MEPDVCARQLQPAWPSIRRRRRTTSAAALRLPSLRAGCLPLNHHMIGVRHCTAEGNCVLCRGARARAPKSLPRSLNNEVMATCASNSHSATARRAPLHGQKACQNDCALRAAQAESLAGACARQALGRPTLLRCLRQFLRCQPTQQRLSHPWEHNVGEAHC